MLNMTNLKNRAEKPQKPLLEKNKTDNFQKHNSQTDSSLSNNNNEGQEENVLPIQNSIPSENIL